MSNWYLACCAFSLLISHIVAYKIGIDRGWLRGFKHRDDIAKMYRPQ